MNRNTTIRDNHRRIIAKARPPCHICGLPIDWEARYPDPLSYVVDHVIPVIAGGTDTLDNLRAAHQTCNRAKGDKAHADIIRRSGALH